MDPPNDLKFWFCFGKKDQYIGKISLIQTIYEGQNLRKCTVLDKTKSLFLTFGQFAQEYKGICIIKG